MIIDLKNKDGFVYAYVSFNVLNENDVIDNNGTVLMISGCWIHESERNNNVLKQLINLLFKHQTTQNILYVIYERSKYDDRKSGKILVSKFLKYIRES